MTRRLFVVGAGRSGTKFMMNVLNNSDQVHLAPEIHFFSSLIHKGFRRNVRKLFGKRDRYDAKQVAQALLRERHFGTYWRRDNAFDEADILACFSSGGASLREIYAYIIDHDCRRETKDKQELVYVGEKTPANVFHLTELRRWFPDAQFVFMFRDPIEVLSSEVNKDLKPDYPISKDNPIYPYGLVAFVFWEWLIAALHVLRFRARHPGQVILVRHRQMVDDLPGTTRRVAERIGIPFEETLCEVRKVDSSFATGDKSTWWCPPGWIKGCYKLFLGPLDRMMLRRSVHAQD